MPKITACNRYLTDVFATCSNRVRFCALFFPTLLSLVFAGSATADLKGNLTVEVDGLDSQKGELCFKIFSGSKGFPYSNENALTRQCTKVTNKSLTIPLKNISSGSYAVSVFHDLNGDRQLNRNSLGMPTEGFGFSNNPIVRNSPPKYGDCIFLVAGSNTNIKINMKYSIGN